MLHGLVLMAVGIMAVSPIIITAVDAQGEPIPTPDYGPPLLYCNEPRELYLLEERPVCLFPGTFAAMADRGLDVHELPRAPPSDTLDLTDEELLWLGSNPSILVAHNPDWYPIEYADEHGRLAGVTLGYITEFERLTGADFVPVRMDNWAALLDAMREGTADVAFTTANTDDRSEYMGFTTPHYAVSGVLASVEPEQLSLESNITIATIRGYAVEEWLDRNHPEVRYVSVDNNAEGFGLLADGRVDAFADILETIHPNAELHGLTVYNAGLLGVQYDLSVGYDDAHPHLGSILQKTLNAIPPGVLGNLWDSASGLGQ